MNDESGGIYLDEPIIIKQFTVVYYKRTWRQWWFDHVTLRIVRLRVWLAQ